MTLVLEGGIPLVSWLKSAHFFWFGAGPLAALDFDPKEFSWEAEQGKRKHFFAYTPKLGYKILTWNLDPVARWEAKWEGYNLHNENLKLLFSFIWDKNRPAKLASFLWQIAHRALPTISYFQAFRDASCEWCQHPMESIEHCLRECPWAIKFWNLVLRFYAP